MICLAYATGVVNGGKETTAIASIVCTELVSSSVDDEQRLESRGGASSIVCRVTATGAMGVQALGSAR